MLSPTLPLFSGWNWQPQTLPSCTAAVSDTESILSASGPQKKPLLGASLSETYIGFMRRRQMFFYDDTAGVRPALTEPQPEPFLQVCGIPVTANGDPVGSVILLSDDTGKRFAEPELQTVKTAALYLGKLLEE